MEKTNKKKVLSNITEIYIIILVIIFPLFVDSTGFFRILECKYRYFLIINIIYLFSIIITLCYYFLLKKSKFFKGFKLNKIQIAVIIFWIINIISTFASPFLKEYNLFIGVGRGEGLINISLYCLIFLSITIFGEFKKRYILYFSISSIIFSFICILQYIGFNPFNMYQDGIGTHNVSFIGTIGNVDFVSALYCIFLTMDSIAFIFLDKKKLYKTIHLISIYMGFFIFEVLDIRIGAVAFIATLLIITPFIITNAKKLYKLMIIISLILLGYVTNLIINPVFHYSTGKINLELQINYITIVLLVVIIIFMILAHILKNRTFDLSQNKKTIKILYIAILIGIIVILLFIYLTNFQSGTLNEIHQILHGNFKDEIGTYRIFLWKRSISLVKDFPILGTGPDTFTVRFMGKYAQDVAKIGELTINDTASNVYLTMMVNIGIMGLISYIVFIILQIIYLIKNKNEYSIIFLITFICFIIQDFFNLWVVIITPIFWVLMAIQFISINKKCTNEMEEKNGKGKN